MTTVPDSIHATSQRPTPSPGATDDPRPLLSSHAALVVLVRSLIQIIEACRWRLAR
jgi:hypothetical protein